MKQLIVNAEHRYAVEFVNDYSVALQKTLKDERVAVLVPMSLRELIKDLPDNWLIIEVPEGEAQKSIDVFGEVLEQLSVSGFPRAGIVVGIGGGATTDLAGFIAATYMRGVEWLAVPTSLAAMVDAAIGGKTGINLNSGKNLVGAFYSPQKVLVDIGFLATLSERDLSAGLAEVVKCGFIADPVILELLQDNYREHLEELIFRAIQVKAEVVSQDFKESFHREVLNYGHTLGHAIEKHSNYQMRHGECVSIGMIFAAELSKRYSGLSNDAVELHRRILVDLGLPTFYSEEAWPQLYAFMQSDKKKKNSSLRFVTLSKMGVPERLEGVTEEVLKEIYLSTVAGKGK